MTHLMGNQIKRSSMDKEKTVTPAVVPLKPEVGSKHLTGSLKLIEHTPDPHASDHTSCKEPDERNKELQDTNQRKSKDKSVASLSVNCDEGQKKIGLTSGADGYKNAKIQSETYTDKEAKNQDNECATLKGVSSPKTVNGNHVETELRSSEEKRVLKPRQICKNGEILNGKSETSKRTATGLEESSKSSTVDLKEDSKEGKVDTDKFTQHINKVVHSIESVHNIPCEYDNILPRSVELESVENLKLLIESLKPEEVNLSDKLTSITKIIRGQSGEQHSELFIATLVRHGFTQKFESYLNVNGISAVSDLESSKCDHGKKYWPTVKRFLMLLWIACDQSVNFCQHTLTSDILQTLQTDLKRLCRMKYTDSEIETFTVKAILGILHNICRHVPNGKWKLRNDGLVSVVRLYLDSEIPMVRLKSLVILSYILSEAENEMINSEDDNFMFIFKVLGDALHSVNHKSSKYGMGVVEVMKGLNNLAINDENKIRIVRNGGLPLFQEILEGGSLDEVKVTITTLWSLAFHHYNKVKMREMPKIMSKLYEFQHCRDEEICHAARGTFWELENISKSSIGSSVSSSLSADKDPSQPHIMISYQWDSQAVMMKVKDRLRQAGYKVWMDIEHMTGSTLEAMALAVEKAAVVLVCMSQKYKDSPNCRTEAEYVYRLRKDFVPLRLQREYIPDGWLGILVGTRLYFDIYSEDHLDVQVPRLVKELRDRGKISPTLDQPDHSRLPRVPQRMTSREAVPILHHPASPTVSSWTPIDVKHWLTSIGLCDFVQNFDDIDGLLILELQKIQESAPEYFHTILRNDFSLTVTEALKLSRHLRQLS